MKDRLTPSCMTILRVCIVQYQQVHAKRETASQRIGQGQILVIGLLVTASAFIKRSTRKDLPIAQKYSMYETRNASMGRLLL